MAYKEVTVPAHGGRCAGGVDPDRARVNIEGSVECANGLRTKCKASVHDLSLSFVIGSAVFVAVRGTALVIAITVRIGCIYMQLSLLGALFLVLWIESASGRGVWSMIFFAGSNDPLLVADAPVPLITVSFDRLIFLSR